MMLYLCNATVFMFIAQNRHKNQIKSVTSTCSFCVPTVFLGILDWTVIFQKKQKIKRNAKVKQMTSLPSLRCPMWFTFCYVLICFVLFFSFKGVVIQKYIA